MDALTIVLFVVGLALLLVGAELLVRGASRLARALGVSPLVVGLTVVAFGTSAPELAVSLSGVFTGRGGVALGNIVGSNLFNVLFILGLSALIVPLSVAGQLVRLDVPLMIGASVLMLLFGLDGSIGRLDGVVLFALVVGYTVFAVRRSRRETKEIQAEYAAEYGEAGPTPRILVQVVLMVAGLVFLVLGSRWLVSGAVELAALLGVSDLVIALTIVAAGTSLPEVATSIIASLRGERDIAVGNVVGSNLFNILCVLGLTAAASPHGVPVPAEALTADLPFMVAVAVACLPVFFTGHTIARWEGAVFLGYYVAYTVFLVLRAMGHPLLDPFLIGMLGFVVPLTVVTLGVVTWRAVRLQRPAT